jgi:glutamine cyclotransferase
MKKATPALVVLLTVLYSCGNHPAEQPDNNTPNPAPATLTYTIIKTYPHDTTSFTEGLFWLNNKLYESTGNYGESELRVNDLATGKAEKVVKLSKDYFGEGISIINNKLYQLTYKEQKVFVYDPTTFKKIKEFEWTTGQGWGMTHNDSELIIGTGSSNLYFVDPETFKVKHVTGVTDEMGPVTNINELEYVKGVVYANIWQTNTIIKIDPVSGKVLGKMDMTGLLDKAGASYPASWDAEGDVLNGIAYDPAKNSFYITGKDWPLLFEIKLN